MRWINLALLALLGADSTATDPTTLVGRLGSPRFADREAAGRDLERRGAEALPALRRALDDRDPEVRSRASTLIEQIESDLLTRPTLFRLDYQRRPLAEVIKDLSAQGGMALALDDEPITPWSGRRISLREPDPVPFWSAVDGLCRAGGLRVEPNSVVLFDPRDGEPALTLADGAVRPGFVSDRGPFRVKLTGLHFERNLPLEPMPGDPAEPTATELFQAQLQVVAEPRLRIAQVGPIRLTEAVDDRGQSLKPDGDADPIDFVNTVFVGPDMSPSIQFSVELRRPERPGRLIRRLSGTIPLLVASRRGEPLVIALADAKGKTFTSGDLSLSVDALRLEADEQSSATLDLTIRPTPGRSAGAWPPSTEFLSHQFEVRDSRGRPFVIFPQLRDEASDAARLGLVLAPGDGASAPAQLRFHGLSRAKVDVEFTFENVKLP